MLHGTTRQAAGGGSGAEDRGEELLLLPVSIQLIIFNDRLAGPNGWTDRLEK
jgi:hypothetical protein